MTGGGSCATQFLYRKIRELSHDTIKQLSHFIEFLLHFACGTFLQSTGNHHIVQYGIILAVIWHYFRQQHRKLRPLSSQKRKLHEPLKARATSLLSILLNCRFASKAITAAQHSPWAAFHIASGNTSRNRTAS